MPPRMPPRNFHITRRTFSTNERAAAICRKAIALSGAPPSISADEDLHDAGAAVRPVGCTRRVFLLKPFLTSNEIEGLAYRIRTLTKNEAINSVLIATDDRDDGELGALPSVLMDWDDPWRREEECVLDEGFPPAPGQTWHVAGGYDPQELYQSGANQNPESVETLMNNLSQLALATKGHSLTTKVPVITIPHGLVHDGGFAFCLGSYVMATRESCFRILNPSKGLSLDPVGLSYFLPRLGMEFNQAAAKFKGCGMILGLMGYEADSSDMMETGLATNYMDSPASLGMLEHALSEIPPWNQQALVKNPIRFEGEPPPTEDHNAAFRNVAVADAVHCFSAYRADGGEMWTHDENDVFIFEDPSLKTDPLEWHACRRSDLVDYAATFDSILTGEDSPEGILERFREIAARQTEDPEEQEGISVAADFVQRLERQSPLALTVVHRLLQMGADEEETLATCMERERRVQARLLTGPDFENWAKHSAQTSQDKPGSAFAGWKHKALGDVSDDEVQEILGM